MEQGSQLLMDKLQKNDGFTMIEMILTLFVVSIILLSTITYIPRYNENNYEDELKNIEYIFQNAQIRARTYDTYQHVIIYHSTNEIVLKDYKQYYEKRYQLTSCFIVEGGLEDVIYYPTGNTSKFGTMILNCDGDVIKIIFQIQKGRYRIER